jgi:hypothetical protein
MIVGCRTGWAMDTASCISLIHKTQWEDRVRPAYRCGVDSRDRDASTTLHSWWAVMATFRCYQSGWRDRGVSWTRGMDNRWRWSGERARERSQRNSGVQVKGQIQYPSAKGGYGEALAVALVVVR